MANAQFEQMFGWLPGGLLGRPDRSVFASDDDHAALSARLAPTLARGEAVDVEWRLARRDGSRFQARLRAKAIDPHQPTTAGTIWSRSPGVNAIGPVSRGCGLPALRSACRSRALLHLR
jgi:PAS domain S-box-containing protein